MTHDDRRNLQLIDNLNADARSEILRDGVLSCSTAIALADAGVDPDSLQDRLQSELL